MVTSSHGVTLAADLLFEELDKEEVAMIVLPGGLPGAANLDAHEGLGHLIMDFAKPVNRWLLFVPVLWFMETEDYLQAKMQHVIQVSINIWKEQTIQLIW